MTESNVPAVQMPRTFTDEMLTSIATFDDAMSMARAAYGELDVAHEVLGNGFGVLATEDKETLIGVPLALLEWDFHEGDNGEFVSIVTVAYVKDAGPRKLILNDGSTGIKDQIAAYQKKTGRSGGLMVRRGLRRSDYTYTADDGKQKRATTFYLDTSA